ncbi:tyrosine-type recombinase/integrase [Terriglobus albidus]|uniref:Tyrosine-type recombinase/integrase n=1 Tax=Terriglobus albidus TaxID=1592106 RepID=A0A5B9EHJ8_9BACT|nr:tyrosine-type recombinase/integrase [Terriglobus albidus]
MECRLPGSRRLDLANAYSGETAVLAGRCFAKSHPTCCDAAGIRKLIGWHTFRRTYSTLRIANVENVKVVQELMRHANSRSTLDVHSQGAHRA